MKIAVVGAGLMGTRLAMFCAGRDCEVLLVGRDRRRMLEAWQRARDESGEPGVSGVTFSTELEDVAATDLVYESIGEHLDEKHALIAQLEQVIDPATPIVSGTSSFVPHVLAEGARCPQRVFVAHFVHPIASVPIVEACQLEEPDPRALATFEAWLKHLGLHVVRLTRPLTGFIVNRLQFALLREALALVEDGVVASEDLDLVVRSALGPRWAATGPIDSVDLGGIRTFADVARAVVPTLDREPTIRALERARSEGLEGAASGRGFRRWPDGDIERAARARARAYTFAKSLEEG